MRQMRGFTLVELMVVVAIVVILAAIAVPNYLRYGYRARRAEAQELLMRVANAQERYYATTNRYGTLAQISFTNVASELKYYSLALTPASPATTYTATATPIAGSAQAKDDCGWLSINNTGAKKSSNPTTNGSCW